MSSSRGSWFAPEPRLSYNEIKEMMLQAAEAMKEKEEREKEMVKAARGESVLTESKAFNIDVCNTVPDSAKITKHDWRSASAREPRAAASARSGLAWNSRGSSGAFEKWKELHPGITEEYQICEEASGRSDLGNPSENQLLGGGNRRRAGYSCRTTKANIDTIDPPQVVKIGDNSRPDKLSRTKAWVDEAVAQRSFDVAGDSSTFAGDSNNTEAEAEVEVPAPAIGSFNGRRLPVSPEIQEEEEEEAAEIVLQAFEKSAHIEDQLPGRLSQSVRFIKPGTSLPVFFSREQKKKSTSSFRAFSAKLASKLGRLFSSKSARRSPSRVSSSGSADSQSESPKIKSLSLHKWLQWQSSKGRDQGEVPAGPRLQQPTKSGKVEPRRFEIWRKGKENVEVREMSAPPLAAAGHANSMVLKDVDSSELGSACSSSFTSNTSLPPLAGVSSQRVRALGRISRLAERKNRNMWSRHFDTAASPRKQVSPREYLTSVLGWESSLGELPTTTKNCPVNRIWPEQGNSPTGPGDDVLSKTCEGNGQPGPIDIVAAPFVTAEEDDPVGSVGAALPSPTTTGSGFEAKSPSDIDVPEEDVSDSNTDSEENAIVLNLVDYDVFSFDDSVPSADSPESSSATSETPALAANGSPSHASPSVSGDADGQKETALSGAPFQVQTNPFLPCSYQTNPFLSCAHQTNPLLTLEGSEAENVADLEVSDGLNIGEPNTFKCNGLVEDSFSAHYACGTFQCSRLLGIPSDHSDVSQTEHRNRSEETAQTNQVTDKNRDISHRNDLGSSLEASPKSSEPCLPRPDRGRDWKPMRCTACSFYSLNSSA